MPGMNRSKKMMMMMTFVQIQNEWIKLRRNLFILFHRSNWIANSLKWNEIQENGFWFGFFLFYYQKKKNLHHFQMTIIIIITDENWRTDKLPAAEAKKNINIIHSGNLFDSFIHSMNDTDDDGNGTILHNRTSYFYSNILLFFCVCYKSKKKNKETLSVD